jgi:hypothetical protein
MMDHDAQAICGPRHARGRERQAHWWGKTNGKIAFHAGKMDIERPRLRGFDGKEHPVPRWEAAVAEENFPARLITTTESAVLSKTAESLVNQYFGQKSLEQPGATRSPGIEPKKSATSWSAKSKKSAAAAPKVIRSITR